MIRSLTGQPVKVLQKREGRKNLKNWLHFKQVLVTYFMKILQNLQINCVNVCFLTRNQNQEFWINQ